MNENENVSSGFLQLSDEGLDLVFNEGEDYGEDSTKYAWKGLWDTALFFTQNWASYIYFFLSKGIKSYQKILCQK